MLKMWQKLTVYTRRRIGCVTSSFIQKGAEQQTIWFKQFWSILIMMKKRGQMRKYLYFDRPLLFTLWNEHTVIVDLFVFRIRVCI